MTGHMAPPNKLQQGPGGTNTNGGKGAKPPGNVETLGLI